jgi:2-keto-4-pentenoate hydratase/2-oxohepta-3-ene-1,7-dioic acid hydratase in catechol pathway
VSVPFAVGTFDAGDGPFPGVVVGEDSVHDATAVAPNVRALLEGWERALPALAALASHDAGRPLRDLRVLAPIEPRQVVQAGANYYKHVLDLIVAERTRAGDDPETARAEGARIMDARVANGEPYLFLGAVGAICGPYDDIVLPARGEQHDWELELAAVVGPGGAVAGYTIANDITTRDLVYRPDLKAIGTDWLRAKNAPTFLPVGPWIVPAQFVPDPGDLQVTLRHNGDVMQDESTADMIFATERLLAYARERLRLLPGDLLLTGSPAGNGAHWNRFLVEGDELEATITGLGTQRNRCVR